MLKEGKPNIPNERQNQVILKMVNYVTIHFYPRTNSVACLIKAIKNSIFHLAISEVTE